jgi:hypothetical protein
MPVEDVSLIQLLSEVQTGVPRTIDELRRDFEPGPEVFDVALQMARTRWLIQGERVGARGYAVVLMPAGRALLAADSTATDSAPA